MPRAFGSYDPTLLVRCRGSPDLPPPDGARESKFAWPNDSDADGCLKWKGSCAFSFSWAILCPPRQAYSHCASVGSAYLTRCLLSADTSFSFLTNSWASFHETFSTGKSSVSIPCTLSLPLPVLQKLLGF